MPPMDKVYGGESIMTTFEGSTNLEYYVSYIDDFRFECENSDNLLEFQEWVALENFFGQRITKKTYEDLAAYYNEDEVVDGEILSLGEEDPFPEAFRAGDSAVYIQPDDRSPCRCTILRIEESCEKYPLYRLGPVYVIKTEDGSEKHALYGELSKQERNIVTNDENDEFEAKCYEAYKLDWMISHGYSLRDIVEITAELAGQAVEDDVMPIPSDGEDVIRLADRLTDDFLDTGFGGGSLYACKGEFLDAEFLDKEYMMHLFSMMPDTEENITRWHEITGITKEAEPETAKVLTLSTAHITPETSDLLDKDVCDELSDVCIYPKIGMPVDLIRKASDSWISGSSFGWWIHIPQDDVSADLHELKNLPQDLFACIRYANGRGCEWLCLDRDGGTVSELPEYDW